MTHPTESCLKETVDISVTWKGDESTYQKRERHMGPEPEAWNYLSSTDTGIPALSPTNPNNVVNQGRSVDSAKGEGGNS